MVPRSRPGESPASWRSTRAASRRRTWTSSSARRSLRYLEVRGTVASVTEVGATRHLDDLASRYLGRPVRYFGECIPARFAETEVPVLCRILPTHVVALDATGDHGDR